MRTGDAPGSRGEEVLAPQVLEELRLIGGEELVRELMGVFAELAPERLRLVQSSFGAGDLEATAAALHSLRSASGTVGARRLADLAGRLERAARSGDGDQLAGGLEKLMREAEEALRAAALVAGGEA